MNLEQPVIINPHEAKHLRTIITIGLSLCLLAILVAYIYYGMKLASTTTEVLTEPLAETPMTPGQEQILQALEAAPIATGKETEAIVEALEAAPSTSDTDRQAILEALQ